MLFINYEGVRGQSASIVILNIYEQDKLITDIDINFIKL